MVEDLAVAREEILGPYRRERAEFQRIAMTLSRLSPLSAYTYSATRLAQTGPDQEARVQAAVERVREGLARVEADLGGRHNRRRNRGRPDLDILPRFQFAWEPVGERFSGAALDCAILIAGSVIFFLGTFVSFLRRDLV